LFLAFIFKGQLLVQYAALLSCDVLFYLSLLANKLMMMMMMMMVNIDHESICFVACRRLADDDDA